MIVTRRSFIAGATAATTAVAAAPLLGRNFRAPQFSYGDATVIDGLGGLNDPYGADDALKITDRAWLEIRKTGITAVRDTLLPVGNHPDAWQEFNASLKHYQGVLAANASRLKLVASASDITTCKRQGTLGIILGTQDTAMIGPALDRLGQMKSAGVRCIQLTYNLANLSGDGSIEPRNGGLTNLGRETIRRIETEKLLLDLSHGGARTIQEATAFATRPLTISHTGARAITDHPRNVSDEIIRAIADKGGVVGIYFMPYLAADMHASGTKLLDHIAHIANIAGEDHVSIGTDGGVLPVVLDAAAIRHAREDYEQRHAAGIAAPGEGPDVFPLVRDYNSIDKLERLSNDLGARGWSAARIEKLLGLNLVRLYRDAWGG